MASYTRQSSFADGDTITAALFNNEFNQLVNAFNNSTGHKHDGTTAEGPVIGLIGDAGETSPNNKVLIDTTNNYIEFYVEVSSSPVQQLYIADGAIVPVTDSDVDLGTSSLYFKDTYTDTVTTTGNVTVGGNLTVTGNATIAGNLTFGDAATDTVAFSADVASNLLPSADNTYDLGASGSEWKDLYVDGIAYVDAINFNGTAITSTATELNIVDGDTTATSTTLADADRVVVNDAGTMVQVALTDFETYFESALDTLSNVTTVGALNSGSITSGFGSIDNGSSAIITTGTITYGSLSDGTITITAFVDEDDMTSDSATLVPTQQSVKAYVDSQVTAQDLDLTTDSGTIAIDLDSETLTIGGTSNEIETSATGNAVTIGIPAAAQITTSLGVGGGSTNGVQISQGAIAIKNGGTQSNIDFYCDSSNAHYARLQAPAHSAFSGNVTLTLPAATGTLVGSGDSGTVSNTMLANSTVSFGGISLALGASDATPAFDLSDATNYPTSSLSGTISNAQLANSTVSYGGVSLALGASDATPAFDLTDATNYPTSSLTGTITNAQLAGSIANAKLANSSISVAAGATSTAIALGGTVTFAGTSNEVDVSESSGTITYGLPSDVTISNDLTVSGNLTVSGTTTQSGPIVSDDNFTGLTNANTGNVTDFGLYGKYVESSTTKYAGIFYDASTDNTFRLFCDTQTEPAATVNTGATGYAAANLVVGTLTGNVTGNLTGDVTGNVSGTAATVTGAAQTNITSLGTLTTLTVDNVIINGTTIGHTSDTDLMTLASGVLTVAGEVDATSLDISGDIDVDGTANLDNTDIDGTLNTSGVVTCQTSANISQVAITSSSNSIAWDAAAAANAYHVTTENTTFAAPSNATEGAIISVEIAQGGTARTIAWNTVFEFAASTAPTITATANKTDILAFRYNGSVWQEIGRVQNLAQT